jgi:NADPH-dependent curcumin reductase CurA
LTLHKGKDQSRRQVKERGTPARRHLSELCPQGIDVDYDNVGDPILDKVLEERIKFHARIVLCGSISQYNANVPFGPANYFNLTLP